MKQHLHIVTLGVRALENPKSSMQKLWVGGWQDLRKVSRFSRQAVLCWRGFLGKN